MNERTHFFIKICISHTLFSKGLMFLWCVRDGWRQEQTGILTQLPLLTIARCVIFKNPLGSSSASWLGLLNRKTLRATALSLQDGSRSGLPVTNSLKGCQHLPIFFHNVHLLPLLLPLIYSGASLIDSLVKGQYITLGHFLCLGIKQVFITREFFWNIDLKNPGTIIGNQEIPIYNVESRRIDDKVIQV